MAKRAAKSGVRLGQNNYGKSRVRMVKVSRNARTRVHTIRDLDVAIALEGDFEAIHTRGDNRLCLPTDTMKNTVYALSKDHPIPSIELFALHLARHFTSRNPHIARAHVHIDEVRWDRLSINGRDHRHAFSKGPDERAWCEVTVGAKGKDSAFTSGLRGLLLLKTTDSGFVGYIRDEYTTLPETTDRIFATSVSASWSYSAKGVERLDFEACRTAIRGALINTFAAHKSLSVQHTLYAMGEAALAACKHIDSIRLSLPNKHCLLVNLQPFGLENPNEIFVPTDEPHGLIEATVERAGP